MHTFLGYSSSHLDTVVLLCCTGLPLLSVAMLRQTTLAGVALGLASLASAQLSSDFESGWDQTVWPVYAPGCQQGGTVSLDTTTAHSGKNSIRVDGAGGYCGHAFFGTNKVPSGDLYVRVWM